MPDPLHVLVAPELYERREEFLDRPVTVKMTEPDQDGRIDLLFTSYLKLWVVYGPTGIFVVRAWSAEEANRRAWFDSHDIEGDVRASAHEMGIQLEGLHAEELVLQGQGGVLAEHTG